MSILSLHDLQENINAYHRKLGIFAICFYISIPAFYYWANLGWTGVDSFYFAAVTFSSVGYGDIVPGTKVQRILTCFFILIGLFLAASLIGAFRSIEKESYSAHGSQRASHPIPIINYVLDVAHELNVETRKLFDRLTFFDSRMLHEIQMNNSNDGLSKILSMKKNLFIRMQDMRYLAFCDFVFIWVIVVIGMGFMIAIEGWTTVDAFYWSIVTISTVGFGDVVPTTNGGKVFCIIFVVVGTVLMGKTISDLIMTPINIRNERNEIILLEQFESKLTASQYHALINNSLCKEVPNIREDSLSFRKAEFMLIILNIMDKVKDDDIIVAGQIFDRYDTAMKGKISLDILNQHIESQRSVSKNSVGVVEQTSMNPVRASFVRTLSFPPRNSVGDVESNSGKSGLFPVFKLNKPETPLYDGVALKEMKRDPKKRRSTMDAAIASLLRDPNKKSADSDNMLMEDDDSSATNYKPLL